MVHIKIAVRNSGVDEPISISVTSEKINREEHSL